MDLGTNETDTAARGLYESLGFTQLEDGTPNFFYERELLSLSARWAGTRSTGSCSIPGDAGLRPGAHGGNAMWSTTARARSPAARARPTSAACDPRRAR